jgi:hypothetical protein
VHDKVGSGVATPVATPSALGVVVLLYRRIASSHRGCNTIGASLYHMGCARPHYFYTHASSHGPRMHVSLRSKLASRHTDIHIQRERERERERDSPPRMRRSRRSLVFCCWFRGPAKHIYVARSLTQTTMF